LSALLLEISEEDGRAAVGSAVTRILIIRDDSRTVELLRAALAPEGYETTIANAASNGLAEVTPPHLTASFKVI
jgi:CheY-like chemotaxis protein